MLRDVTDLLFFLGCPLTRPDRGDLVSSASRMEPVLDHGVGSTPGLRSCQACHAGCGMGCGGFELASLATLQGLNQWTSGLSACQAHRAARPDAVGGASSLKQSEVAALADITAESLSRLKRGRTAESGTRKLMAGLAVLGAELEVVTEAQSGNLDAVRHECAHATKAPSRP